MPLASMTEIIGPARAAGRGRRRVQRHRHRACRGDRGRRRDRPRPGGAPDQRELRRVSRRARTHRRRLSCARALGRGPGRGAPGSRRQRRAGPGGRRRRHRLRHVRRVQPAVPGERRGHRRRHRVVPRPGNLGRGRAWRDRRQERRALATGPHRPGRGGRVRRRHRGRRAGGRDRQLARYADPRCGPRPIPHRQHPPCRQRSARAARLVWRAGPGPGGGRRRPG